MAVPAGTRSFVLGASKVVLAPGTRVGAQVERTVRDWLSYQMQWDERDRPVPKDSLLTWHEGARLRDLLDAVPEKIVPLTGALAARQGDRWLAADEEGVFRFEVLEDKMQYPTTLEYDGVALLRDTHGISALVEPAVRERAGLVVGCGDAVPKMEAAVWLARRGVNVWFPCDRFVGDVLGYEGTGVLLGSAPVRAEGGRAVIGDRPVAFRADETIVVEDFTGRGPLRYYDAPARYFRALGAALPSLKLDFVDVDDAGQSDRIVRRAEADRSERDRGARPDRRGRRPRARVARGVAGASRGPLPHRAVPGRLCVVRRVPGADHVRGSSAELRDSYHSPPITTIFEIGDVRHLQPHGCKWRTSPISKIVVMGG